MLFTHLHVHSCYSFLRGLDRPEALARAAAEMGYTSLALTDTGGLYAAVLFQKACQERGIAPIFGVELPPSSDSDNGTVVLLVRNEEGWKRLCRITSKHATGKEFDLVNELTECEDLYVLSRDRAFLQKARGVIPSSRLFAELIVHDEPAGARSLARWADEHGISCVVTNDVHFIRPESRETAKVLAAIRMLEAVGRLSQSDIPSPRANLADPADMYQRFKWQPQAFANAQRIAEDCRFTLALDRRRIPVYDRLETDSAMGDLRLRCLDGLSQRYPNGSASSAVARLNAELKVVEHHGFADYMLIVSDIVRETVRRGYRTFGRGSAAGSLICYLLFITHVDPLRHDLPFERFMNMAREDLPDIDLDFSWKQRDEMLDWIYDRWGHDRVAMISVHSTLKARGSMREVAKALGMPEGEINRVVKRLPNFITLEHYLRERETIPEARGLPLEEEPWVTIMKHALRIDGHPRHIGEHPCGIVISPERIDEIVPLQTGAKGHDLTQMDMYSIEDLGLVKIDILGQRSLAVIADTLEVVNSRRSGDQEPLTHDDLVLDEPTRRNMKAGRSMGCFYIESPAMVGLLVKMMCETYERLVIASSVVRPGPAHSGMTKSYLRRLHGMEPVKYLHPAMERLLAETLGIMVFQEDVMRIASSVGQLSMGEADSMRRSMTWRRNRSPIMRLRERFLKGASANGCTAQTAKEIWRQIESFAGYAFCKSHSASFAQVSIEALHLRTHYPAEFMAAVLSNGGGFYSASAYIQEARRMGLHILPPLVSKAKYDYQGVNGYLMVGLGAVKNLQLKTIERIVALQPFASVEEFLEQVKPASDEATELVHSGALDRMGYSRTQLMCIVSQRFETHDAPVLDGVDMRAPDVPDVPAPSPGMLLEGEIESLGFSVTAHPLTLFRRVAEKERVIPVSALHKHVGRKVKVLLWMIHSMRTRTNRGKLMRFMSCEDLQGRIECVVFPPVYSKYGHMIDGNGPYLVYGTVLDDFGSLSIDVHWLRKVGSHEAERLGEHHLLRQGFE